MGQRDPLDRHAASDLAERIAVVVRHPDRQRVHPESFLLCVISRYQRANFGRH